MDRWLPFLAVQTDLMPACLWVSQRWSLHLFRDQTWNPLLFSASRGQCSPIINSGLRRPQQLLGVLFNGPMVHLLTAVKRCFSVYSHGRLEDGLVLKSLRCKTLSQSLLRREKSDRVTVLWSTCVKWEEAGETDSTVLGQYWAGIVWDRKL